MLSGGFFSVTFFKILVCDVNPTKKSRKLHKLSYLNIILLTNCENRYNFASVKNIIKTQLNY